MYSISQKVPVQFPCHGSYVSCHTWALSYALVEFPTNLCQYIMWSWLKEKKKRWSTVQPCIWELWRLSLGSLFIWLPAAVQMFSLNPLAPLPDVAPVRQAGLGPAQVFSPMNPSRWRWIGFKCLQKLPTVWLQLCRMTSDGLFLSVPYFSPPPPLSLLHSSV